MKTKKLLLLSALALLLVGTGCKKYENGPMISFHSKKGRVVNNWKVITYKINGQDESLDGEEILFDFNEDYTGKLTDKVPDEDGDVDVYEDTFKWNFNGDKTKLILTYNDGDTYDSGDKEEYTILELRESSMQLRLIDGNDREDYYLIPQ